MHVHLCMCTYVCAPIRMHLYIQVMRRLALRAGAEAVLEAIAETNDGCAHSSDYTRADDRGRIGLG